MFYELHELVVFINNAAQLIQDKQTAVQEPMTGQPKYQNITSQLLPVH